MDPICRQNVKSLFNTLKIVSLEIVMIDMLKRKVEKNTDKIIMKATIIYLVTLRNKSVPLSSVAT